MAKFFRSKSGMVTALILLALGFTIAHSKHVGQENLVNPLPRTRQAASLAIANIYYGLDGFRGYQKIFEKFTEHQSLENPKEFNKVLKEARYMGAAAGTEVHLMSDDIGLADYFMLAFRTFGLKIQSVYHLYFTLLSISIFIFLLTFRKQPSLLVFLLFYVVGHYIILMAPTLHSNTELQVTNNRFYPTLGVISALHLAFLTLFRQKTTPWLMVGAVLQALVLAFSINARSSGSYQMLFLFFFGAFILFREIQKSSLSFRAFSSIWPVLLAFVVFAGIKINQTRRMDPAYNEVLNNHNFWCSMLVGLNGHPDATKRGLIYNDRTCYLAVERQAKLHGYKFDAMGVNMKVVYDALRPEIPHDPNTIRFLSPQFEAMAKAEYFTILKESPWRVATYYLYHFPQFVSVYFSTRGTVDENDYFSASSFLFRWYTVAFMVFALLLTLGTFTEITRMAIQVVLLQFSFALINPIFFSPKSVMLADSALIFSMLLFVCCYFVAHSIYRVTVNARLGPERAEYTG